MTEIGIPYDLSCKLRLSQKLLGPLPLHLLLMSANITAAMVKPGKSSTIELMVAIFAACVPTYHPLVRHYASGSAQRQHKSTPHAIGSDHSEGKYTKEQFREIELVDKSIGIGAIGGERSHWLQIEDDEEMLVKN